LDLVLLPPTDGLQANQPPCFSATAKWPDRARSLKGSSL